jgi:predicted Zn-dependent protease
MAVTLNDVPARQLEVLPASDEFCLGFSVSSAALALPPAELRALVAHGLAHLELGHATTLASPSGTSRSRARGYTQARSHSPEEEAEADRQAARRLTAAAGSAGCTGLVEVLERAAAEGERWSEWTAQHPLTRARANAARGWCAARR